MQKQFLIFTDLLICKIYFYDWKKNYLWNTKWILKRQKQKSLATIYITRMTNSLLRRRRLVFSCRFFIQQKVCCQLNAFNDKHIKKVNKRIFKFIHFTSKICWFISSFHFWLERKSLLSKIMMPFLKGTKNQLKRNKLDLNT